MNIWAKCGVRDFLTSCSIAVPIRHVCLIPALLAKTIKPDLIIHIYDLHTFLNFSSPGFPMYGFVTSGSRLYRFLMAPTISSKTATSRAFSVFLPILDLHLALPRHNLRLTSYFQKTERSFPENN